MFYLFPHNVAVPGVTREVFDREQIDESQVDVAEVGVGSDLVEVEVGGDYAGTLAGHLEFGDHIGHRFSVINDVVLLTLVLSEPPRLRGVVLVARTTGSPILMADGTEHTPGRSTSTGNQAH